MQQICNHATTALPAVHSRTLSKYSNSDHLELRGVLDNVVAQNLLGNFAKVPSHYRLHQQHNQTNRN